MRPYYGFFLGRPPLAPFARAAAAFASDVTLPPLRPSATAAGFLRGTAGAFPCLHDAPQRTAREVVDGAEQHLSGKERRGCVRAGVEHLDGGGEFGRVGLQHGSKIPNRLGYVKWVFSC